MGRRARVYHEPGCWLIFLDCFNTFNIVKRVELLKELATCAPGLAPLVAKCYGAASVAVLVDMEL